MRQSIRLPGHDYSAAGAYFVTVCTYQRLLLFTDPELQDLVTVAWQNLPEHFSSIALDEFVVMPNHVHFIVWLRAAYMGGADGKLDASDQVAQTVAPPTLSAVVGALKSIVAVTYLQWIKQHAPERSGAIWQRNYYEHIIRNSRELDLIRQYIIDNPTRWAEDRDNRDNLDTLISRMTAHS